MTLVCEELKLNRDSGLQPLVMAVLKYLQENHVASRVPHLTGEPVPSGDYIDCEYSEAVQDKPPQLKM